MSHQPTLRDNLGLLSFPMSFKRKRLTRGSFPCLLLHGVSAFQVCFCQISISTNRDKQRLSADIFNVNSNEFLMSVEAIVSDTGAQRSVQLTLRWAMTAWRWVWVWEVFQLADRVHIWQRWLQHNFWSWLVVWWVAQQRTEIVPLEAENYLVLKSILCAWSLNPSFSQNWARKVQPDMASICW